MINETKLSSNQSRTDDEPEDPSATGNTRSSLKMISKTSVLISDLDDKAAAASVDIEFGKRQKEALERKSKRIEKNIQIKREQ